MAIFQKLIIVKFFQNCPASCGSRTFISKPPFQPGPILIPMDAFHCLFNVPPEFRLHSLLGLRTEYILSVL
jgi:hypothetical protein